MKTEKWRNSEYLIMWFPTVTDGEKSVVMVECNIGPYPQAPYRATVITGSLEQQKEQVLNYAKLLKPEQIRIFTDRVQEEIEFDGAVFTKSNRCTREELNKSLNMLQTSDPVTPNKYS